MTYRVLALDGGGIKGTFTASFLATIEDSIGQPISHYFDLVVGTSTGGIIALGLGAGFPATEILELYADLGPSVFGKNGWTRRFRQWFRPKYDGRPLRGALSAKFGGRRLGESTTRLVVPSVNLETGEVHVYKTSHHPRFERDYKEFIVEVALATASAPTYFPIHKPDSGIPMVDGGLWANNPTGMGAVEAVAVLNWPRGEIRILSLGCTTSPLDCNSLVQRSGGRLDWVFKLMDVILAAQSSASHGTAKLLVGEENLLRVSPTVPPGRFSLDSIDGISSLKGLGQSEARKALPQLRPMFFVEPADPFEPYHKL